MKIDSKIKVSVIMPSFLGEYDGCASDRENKLIRAVHSFLENSLYDKELIIIGDNCKITEEVLIDYFHHEISIGRIKFHQFKKKQKLFSGVLRSKGIELASGEYISYLDSDDLLGKNHLSSIYNQVKTNNLDWAYFNDFINSDAGLITKNVELKKDSIGTSSIIHRNDKKLNWDKCDGYGHDYMFIEKLMKWSTKKDKIYGGTYIICHIPNQIDR
jgi:glycosyltransferase involved in cell wall biosynthesis